MCVSAWLRLVASSEWFAFSTIPRDSMTCESISGKPVLAMFVLRSIGERHGVKADGSRCLALVRVLMRKCKYLLVSAAAD